MTNLVEVGRTRPETRLIAMSTNPTASSLRRGHTSAHTSGRTASSRASLGCLGWSAWEVGVGMGRSLPNREGGGSVTWRIARSWPGALIGTEMQCMSQLTNVLTRHLSAALATAGVLGGCAVPGALGPADGLTRGRAELAAGNYASARDAFRTWVASRPDDARAQLGLAAAYEGLDQLDSARAVYAGIAATRLPGGVRRQLEGRLRLLARREMAEAASAAVANEAVLSTSPPRPNSVAVLPFRYLGNDDQLRPLERGLSQLVVTDLSQVRSLVLLEREAVQRLLNEIRLAFPQLAHP